MSILVRDFRASTMEAENGLQGLELLGRESFDLVLLDLEMPLLDGEEVLTAMRASPELRTVPVVVLSGVREDHRVRGVVAAGVSDYLTKPIRPEVTAARLARFFERLPAPAPVVRSPRRGPVEAGASVALVDSDPLFRECFETALSGQYNVACYADGTQALAGVLAAPPAALFVGSKIGILTSDLLLQRVRRSPDLANVLLVAILPTSPAAPSGPKGTLWDATLRRSCLEEGLLESVLQVLRPEAATGLANQEAVRREVLTATEQTFSLLLGLRLDGVPVDQVSAPQPGLVVTARLLAPHDEVIRLELRVPLETATAVAQRQDGDPAPAGHEQDRLERAGQTIAARLCNALAEHGLPASTEALTVASLMDAAPPPPSAFIARFKAPPAACSVEVVIAATG